MSTNVRLNIQRRINFADGMSFGDTGPYERLVGTASYALDPNEPRLADIVDLDLAPHNAQGLVEFEGDLDILKPVDLERGNRRLFYEVSNRGGRSLLRSFNDGPQNPDPTTAADAGNGYLMKKGYTLVLSGWQGDLVPGTGIVAYLPEAKQDGQPLRGEVRQEFILERPGVLSQPVSGGVNIQCYPVLNLDGAALTEREHEADPRRLVARDRWQFAKAERDAATEQVKVTPSNVDLYLKDGFQPGWIYELIYETEGSRVMGLGPAGIRDLMSFFRYEAKDAAGEPNPFAGYVDKLYAYGASLSARVVRQFVYDGFNEDAQGRQVFDAIYPHVSGGGRVWINQRFAQVGRFPRQHEEHQWPSERYPFAYGAVPDLFTEKVDAVLKRPATDPIVMHTHSATEYWQRHASLGQIDLRSSEDIDMPETVRAYFLASFPHGAMASAPADYPGQQEPNGLAAGPFFRACLEAMDRWATEGVAPPPSRLPKLAEGTLATPEEVLERFPKVPGVTLPKSPSRLPFYDYGSDFDRGLLTKHPPQLTGNDYPILLPQVDADGNDAGGLRSPDIAVPVGTFTGWMLRRSGYAEGDLLGLNGSFIPFARTKAQREAKGDPRLSIEERYQSHDAYVQSVRGVVEDLMRDGLLLREDGDRYIEAARKRNPLDPSVPLGPLLGE